MGDWVTGAGARPLRGRAPRMSRVQPARAYDALYGAWGTRATPSRPTRATPRAPEDGLTAHRSPHPPPNVAFSQTPCTPCPGRGTTTASRRAPPTPRRLCLCGRTCSLRAPTTRRTRRGACARRPPNARFHRSPLPPRSLSRPYLAHEKRKTKNASRARPPFAHDHRHDDTGCARATRSRPARTSRARSDRRPPPGAPGRSEGAATAASTSFASAERGTRDDSFASAGGGRGPSRFRRPVAQRPVERAVDRPAHAPRTAAPYEAVDSTVMARAVPRRRIAPPKSRAAGTQSDYRESEARRRRTRPRRFSPDAPEHSATSVERFTQRSRNER